MGAAHQQLFVSNSRWSDQEVRRAAAQYVKPDVMGPHGEPLAELRCWLPDECISLARRLCDGDFDVVISSTVPTQRGVEVVMLLHCKDDRVIALPTVEENQSQAFDPHPNTR